MGIVVQYLFVIIMLLLFKSVSVDISEHITSFTNIISRCWYRYRIFNTDTDILIPSISDADIYRYFKKEPIFTDTDTIVTDTDH